MKSMIYAKMIIQQFIVYLFLLLTSCALVLTPPPKNPYYQYQIEHPSIFEKSDSEDNLSNTEKKLADKINVTSYEHDGKQIIIIELNDEKNEVSEIKLKTEQKSK
jgi:hypothetical protein